VLQNFQSELDKAISLVVFIPLVISSGGNAGSQSSTVITRALALGEVTLRDFMRVLNREIVIGLGLGLILGIIGVVRAGHPLCKGEVTPARYAAAAHILVSRRGGGTHPVDAALAQLGLERAIATTVVGFPAALALARASDLVATVPERHTGELRAGMHSFALPLAISPFTVSMLWHPRMDGDPAHRWLRGCVRDACAEQPDSAPIPADAADT
jgi:DNA-binding transcriptional LysR family regulator